MSENSFTSIMARPVLILGATVAILSLGLSACSVSLSGARKPSDTSPTRTPTPTTSATTNDYVPSRVGECFQYASDDTSDVTIVDCNQPHDAEYFHIFDFSGDAFPSDDEFDDESDEICGLIFEYYVGKPVADSTVDYSWYVPTQETWTNGDHTIQCYAFAKNDSKLTRSVKDSNM